MLLEFIIGIIVIFLIILFIVFVKTFVELWAINDVIKKLNERK